MEGTASSVVAAVQGVDISAYGIAGATIGVVGLAAAAGWRLACKMLNRGVGK